MNEKKKSLLTTVPAARELRKVPGFDPLKYLRTISRNGEKVLKLDLCYKKVWFRLACPNGRMCFNPLRIRNLPLSCRPWKLRRLYLHGLRKKIKNIIVMLLWTGTARWRRQRRYRQKLRQEN